MDITRRAQEWGLNPPPNISIHACTEAARWSTYDIVLALQLLLQLHN